MCTLRGETLKQHRLFVSLGHDEYWTKQQRDAVEAARDAGMNIAFFSGNECYWQSRLEPSSTRHEARVLTCYKDATLDPKARDNPKETTVLFTDPPVSRPQSMLSGLAYGSNTQPDYIAWRPANIDTWIFDGNGHPGGRCVPRHRRLRIRPHGAGRRAPGRADGRRQLARQRLPRQRHVDLRDAHRRRAARRSSRPARSPGRGGSTTTATRATVRSPTIACAEADGEHHRPPRPASRDGPAAPGHAVTCTARAQKDRVA